MAGHSPLLVQGLNTVDREEKGGSKVKSKRIKGWVLVYVDRVRQENESTKPVSSSLTLNRRVL